MTISANIVNVTQNKSSSLRLVDSTKNSLATDSGISTHLQLC